MVRVAEDEKINVLRELDLREFVRKVWRGNCVYTLGCATRGVGAKGCCVDGRSVKVAEGVGVGCGCSDKEIVAIELGHPSYARYENPVASGVAMGGVGYDSGVGLGCGRDGCRRFKDWSATGVEAEVTCPSVLAKLKDVGNGEGGLERDQADLCRRPKTLIYEAGAGPGSGTATVVDEEVAEQSRARVVL